MNNIFNCKDELKPWKLRNHSKIGRRVNVRMIVMNDIFDHAEVILEE